MRTNIIRTGSLKAMAGVALATAISSELTQAADQAAWDKTFPKSEKVEHRKVTFKNRYGITLSADLYQPKNRNGKLAAIAVSGPFGAVKEQSSGLYAQTMAEMIAPRPILLIAGEKAHSRYYSEDVYKLASDPKELLIVPGADHVDLYDKMDKIPFDKLAQFFTKNLK